MPKVAVELAPIAVAKLTAPGRHAVGQIPGLYLYIQPSGARSWVLRTTVGQRRRHIGLGPFPAVSLKEARAKAREHRATIARGEDPVIQRQVARAALIDTQSRQKTFEWCARQCIADRKDEWQNSKHRQQWLSTLQTYAFPLIGEKPVTKITLQDVMDVLNQEQSARGEVSTLWKAKTETATRLRQRIEYVLNWATVRQYRSGLNPALWKGQLETTMPKPSKIARKSHMPALPHLDIGEFLRLLRGQAGVGARALEFAILTASRSGEVRGATWSEIDKKNALWTIPAQRMKAGKEHRVPLSAQALQLLSKLPRHPRSTLVFASTEDRQLSEMTLSAAIKRMNEKECRWKDPTNSRAIVPHGFRSTFRDWAGESVGHAREVIEHALAHRLKDKSEAAYARSDLLAKRRQLMQDWADYCDVATCHLGHQNIFDVDA